MKKIVIAIGLLLFMGREANAQLRNILSLSGKWEAIGGKSEGGGLEVVDSANTFLLYGSLKMKVISFKADFSKSPCWFDFTLKDSTQEIHLKSLIQFISDDLCQWQLFDGADRPGIFASDRGDLFFLKRKKQPVSP